MKLVVFLILLYRLLIVHSRISLTIVRSKKEEDQPTYRIELEVEDETIDKAAKRILESLKKEENIVHESSLNAFALLNNCECAQVHTC